MGIEAIKAEQVTSIALALLAREVMLPSLVWQNPVGDFTGAKDDTVSVRLPAYAIADTRTLRSGTTRNRRELTERKVDLTLDTNVYFDTVLTDEQLDLDIADFSAQVLKPVTSAVARGLEDVLAGVITNTSYDLAGEIDEDDPYPAIVDARKQLNDAKVPFEDRTLLVGSSVEAALLGSDRFVRFDSVGTSSESALREATIGRIAGFNVVTSQAINDGAAYAFHKTAYAMSTRAPKVRDSAPYGASMADANLAMRLIKTFDADPEVFAEILAVDSWCGASVVTDNGSLDGAGRFTPSEDNDESDLVVRAVELSIGS